MYDLLERNKAKKHREKRYDSHMYQYREMNLLGKLIIEEYTGRFQNFLRMLSTTFGILFNVVCDNWQNGHKFQTTTKLNKENIVGFLATCDACLIAKLKYRLATQIEKLRITYEIIYLR